MINIYKYCLFIFILLISLSSIISWDYNLGGLDWPSSCSSKDIFQGPINVCPPFNDIKEYIGGFKYKFYFSDSETEYSYYHDGNNLKLEGDFGHIELNNQTYFSSEINIYSPSTHTVNNKRYPMEFQIISKNSQGNLVTIVLMIKESKLNNNSLLSKIGFDNEANKNMKPFIYKNINQSIDLNRYLYEQADFFIYNSASFIPDCDKNNIVMISTDIFEANINQIKNFPILIRNNNRIIQNRKSRSIYITFDYEESVLRKKIVENKMVIDVINELKKHNEEFENVLFEKESTNNTNNEEEKEKVKKELEKKIKLDSTPLLIQLTQKDSNEEKINELKNEMEAIKSTFYKIKSENEKINFSTKTNENWIESRTPLIIDDEENFYNILLEILNSITNINEIKISIYTLTSIINFYSELLSYQIYTEYEVKENMKKYITYLLYLQNNYYDRNNIIPIYYSKNEINKDILNTLINSTKFKIEGIDYNKFYSNLLSEAKINLIIEESEFISQNNDINDIDYIPYFYKREKIKKNLKRLNLKKFKVNLSKLLTEVNCSNYINNNNNYSINLKPKLIKINGPYLPEQYGIEISLNSNLNSNIESLYIGKDELGIFIFGKENLHLLEVKYKNKIYKLQELHIFSPVIHEIKNKNASLELQFITKDDNNKMGLVVLFEKSDEEGDDLLKKIGFDGNNDDFSSNLNKSKLVELESKTEDIFKALNDLFKRIKLNYLLYNGSSMYYKCLNNVKWIILTDVQKINKKQIEYFKALNGKELEKREEIPLADSIITGF